MVRVCSALEVWEELSLCAARVHLGAGRNKWRGYLRFGAACEKRRAVKRWLGPIYWEDYMIRASFGYWLNLGLPA